MLAEREDEIMGHLRDIFQHRAYLVDKYPAECLIILLKAIDDDVAGRNITWPGTMTSFGLVHHVQADAYCTLDEEHLAWQKEYQQEQLKEQKAEKRAKQAKSRR